MPGVTLCGSGPSWKFCEDKTKEMWGNLCNIIKPGLSDKKWTKLFVFDGLMGTENDVVRKNELLEKSIEVANQKGITIIGNQPFCTEQYPIQEVVRKFNASYFMPSMSYMIAYALYLGHDTIYLHGIDGGPQWHYQFGKPQIMFWIGYATALKVRIRMGADSLRWAYQVGLDTFPKAYLVNEVYDCTLPKENNGNK